jgi:molybdate transport system regulatory protein
MQISARNQINVTIKEIEIGAVNSVIIGETAQGMKLSASITNGSAQSMNLIIGDNVLFFFKASNVLIVTGTVPAVSARNILIGVIKDVIIGAVNSEVVMTLSETDKLISVITNDAIKELNLKIGDKAAAIIKASEVMIAK